MKKRRFSITKEQGDLLLSALAEYIEMLEQCVDTAKELGNSYTYEQWRKGEAQRLYLQIDGYKWDVE